jgi:hypothetical protein
VNRFHNKTINAKENSIGAIFKRFSFQINALSVHPAEKSFSPILRWCEKLFLLGVCLKITEDVSTRVTTGKIFIGNFSVMLIKIKNYLS